MNYVADETTDQIFYFLDSFEGADIQAIGKKVKDGRTIVDIVVGNELTVPFYNHVSKAVGQYGLPINVIPLGETND